MKNYTIVKNFQVNTLRLEIVPKHDFVEKQNDEVRKSYL